MEYEMKNTLMILGLVGLMTAAPVMARENGSGTIQSREDYGSVSSFCRDRLQVLKSAYRLAEIESQAGNHARSAAILEGGLRDAAARIQPAYGSTLTSKAIKRGLVLLENLKATEDSRQKVRTINNFLFNYFLFVENVSNRLDIPYFQTGRGFSAISTSNVQFEKLFVNFAQEQVSMVLSTMSTTANEGRRATIYPIGSPTLLLTALKVTTAAMANDLSESIFASRYACTIDRLDQVSADIALYLSTRSTYADEYMAVQELVGAVKAATQASVRECGGIGGYEDNTGGYSQPEARTTDALRGSVTLYAGTTQQVRLNGARYIKKLIISAEGVRNDAMFDVVVNGDVKGTIFVPGRDPSYFVTVEDYADSIELVSRGGTAVVSRILVVAE
jgi:hypothetical protein